MCYQDEKKAPGEKTVEREDERLTAQRLHKPHTHCQAPRPACQPSANKSAKFNTFMMASFTKLTCRSKPQTEHGLCNYVCALPPNLLPDLNESQKKLISAVTAFYV